MAQSEPMKQILDILNPVHEPTVGEWKRIAIVVNQISFNVFGDTMLNPRPNDLASYQVSQKYYSTISGLMQRWEELTRGKWVDGERPPNHDIQMDKAIPKIFQPAILTKEMFVCEVVEPAQPAFQKNIAEWERKNDHYTKAQEQVLFEGFEMEHHYVRMSNVNSPIQFYTNDSTLLISGYRIYEVLVKKATLSDLITEIGRYNRTATKPIEIKWTENIVKKLLA